MTLATHIVIATAIAKPAIVAGAGPFAPFVIGVLSHYASDAIPHYDYPLLSAKQERAEKLVIELNPTKKNITADLLKIALDIAIGGAAVLIVAKPALSLPILLGYALAGLGAVLPDALQSVYWFWRKTPIKELKIVHDCWHSKLRLKKDWLGLGSQTLIFLTALILLAH